MRPPLYQAETAQRGPTSDDFRAAAPTQPLNSSPAAWIPPSSLLAAPELVREWADDFLPRARRLQRLVPPTAQLPIVFTHIPKCAGSTFRNQLLLELTRIFKARPSHRFACVLYRDVLFREHQAITTNATLTRHGPACLAADGYFKPRLLVSTFCCLNESAFALQPWSYYRLQVLTLL